MKIFLPIRDGMLYKQPEPKSMYRIVIAAANSRKGFFVMKRNHALSALGMISLFVLAAFQSACEEELEIIAGPYLQYPTETSMTVGWETSQPASTEAGQGKKADALTWVSGTGGETFHTVVFENLEPGGNYFYRVRSGNDAGVQVESDIYTFQTAVAADTPFSFVVISDTQSNPANVAKQAELSCNQRPHFVLLTGDLVSRGEEKELWNNHFFRNMRALISRVPLVPCLGNHDDDAPAYYSYFTLPAPEYYYKFTYGNLDIFVVDSQRPLTRGSEQYTWLENALAASTATWKIVGLHKAAYSSDEDDYGDTTMTQTFRGDITLRALAAPCEQHKVDIVWCGHIHSYERTYPLVQGKPVLDGGVVYMITGGGGGGLEKAAPWRSLFTAKVYSGHHYCLVNVFGPTMRVEAYTPEGTLFDFLELRK